MLFLFSKSIFFHWRDVVKAGEYRYIRDNPWKPLKTLQQTLKPLSWRLRAAEESRTGETLKTKAFYLGFPTPFLSPPSFSRAAKLRPTPPSSPRSFSRAPARPPGSPAPLSSSSSSLSSSKWIASSR